MDIEQLEESIKPQVNQYRKFGGKGLFRDRKDKTYLLELNLKALELYATTAMSFHKIVNKLVIKNFT